MAAQPERRHARRLARVAFLAACAALRRTRVLTDARTLAQNSGAFLHFSRVAAPLYQAVLPARSRSEILRQAASGAAMAEAPTGADTSLTTSAARGDVAIGSSSSRSNDDDMELGELDALLGVDPADSIVDASSPPASEEASSSLQEDDLYDDMEDASEYDEDDGSVVPEAVSLPGREQAALRRLAGRRKKNGMMTTINADAPWRHPKDFLDAVSNALAEEELVLLRTEEATKKGARKLGAHLAQMNDAALVQTLGKTILLYKPSPAQKIDLASLAGASPRLLES
eukprot:TRINITY_DN42150_c0_g1_i1.p1 TRINITY_DN42150_c0_g1~~TRINITY_DN42150_c0_g1_i1.p1  ORF type:complete len:285 (+),score=60.56 TRINITY_DN42150_c0_g1_i1:73-927(+)